MEFLMQERKKFLRLIGLLNEVSSKRRVGSTLKSLFATKELTGNAKRKLVDFAREEKADLIVMGATGADFFEHLLLGSTTHYVIDHAPCDVLIVK